MPSDAPIALSISIIRTDCGTQPRASLDDDRVAEYREAKKRGARLPAVTVFYDGSSYVLADGFHRFEVARKDGDENIMADIRQGTVRDAKLYSASANATHGLHRSNADKNRAVEMILSDEEWRTKSPSWIADVCRVSNHTVSKVIARLYPEIAESRVRETKAGRTIDTSKIGQSQKKPGESETRIVIPDSTREPEPKPAKALQSDAVVPEWRAPVERIKGIAMPLPVDAIKELAQFFTGLLRSKAA